MFSRLKTVLLGTALSTVLLSFAVSATPVTAIKVTGNTRVEAETVAAYLPFKVGDDFTPEQTGTLIRSLYGTGLFANVELNQSPDGTVLVTVVENPMVNRVVFEGNEKIASERLAELVSLKSRGIYSPSKVQQDIQALQAAYRSRGRFTTSVDAQLIEREQNRVDVIYKVTEGEKTRIADINFVGNKKISDGSLAEVITTRPSAWWRFLSQADTYDAARLEVDKDLLRRYYLSQGYADVQITSAVAELTRNKEDFILTYTVFEGPRYDFGQVDVALKAEAEGLDMAAVKHVVTLKSGELFDASRIQKSQDAIIDVLGNKGFAFLGVEPAYARDEANRKIDVTFNVTPGPRGRIAPHRHARKCRNPAAGGGTQPKWL
jgi:outer membrane protein insertion porin family